MFDLLETLIHIFTFQMSEQLNQELSLTGKIPSGLFNAMFEFSGCWQKDAAYTKTLAFDGMFITLYTVALEKSQLLLKDHVKKEVPSSWEPAALARYVLRLPSLELSSYTTTAGIPFDLFGVTCLCLGCMHMHACPFVSARVVNS